MSKNTENNNEFKLDEEYILKVINRANNIKKSLNEAIEDLQTTDKDIFVKMMGMNLILGVYSTIQSIVDINHAGVLAGKYLPQCSETKNLQVQTWFKPPSKHPIFIYDENEEDVEDEVSEVNNALREYANKLLESGIDINNSLDNQEITKKSPLDNPY
jgi:hypothetical protein